ncbi:MAG: hypothetical protein JWQ73_2272 [Variovorax sp.]|nr:hypothetical protein [Variovorax sp.]
MIVLIAHLRQRTTRSFGGQRKKPATDEVAGFSCRSWWLFTDSNRGPVDYDSIALTD